MTKLANNKLLKKNKKDSNLLDEYCLGVKCSSNTNTISMPVSVNTLVFMFVC